MLYHIGLKWESKIAPLTITETGVHLKSNERKRVPSTHLPFLFSIGEQFRAFFCVYQMLRMDLGSEINQTSGFHNYRDCFCLVCVATVTRPFPQIVNRRFHYKHSTATLAGLLVQFLNVCTRQSTSIFSYEQNKEPRQEATWVLIIFLKLHRAKSQVNLLVLSFDRVKKNQLIGSGLHSQKTCIIAQLKCKFVLTPLLSNRKESWTLRHCNFLFSGGDKHNV